eukprot:scaffold22635_cov134-Cylindrotheca_fusiformis.AAC.2
MDSITTACSQLEKSDASLTLLNLNCEYIGATGAQRLARSCSACQVTSRAHPHPHSPMVALWLENNEIHANGAEAVSHIIEASPSLRYLYVSHNMVNNSGIVKISQAASRQLEVFHIGDNEIGPAGARVVADVLLDENSTIRNLVLESNHLEDQGAIVIADGLKRNMNVLSLDLRYNRIGQAGLDALLEVLKSDNKTLQFLFLEEDHNDNCTRRPSRRQGNKHKRLAATESGLSCSCERCQTMEQINYFLALNRAGRHTFANPLLPTNLWPRIISRVSESDPSLIYTMLATYKPELSKLPARKQ